MGRIRDGHIGYAEAIALIVIYVSAKIILPLPAYIVKEGQGASWLVIAIGLVAAILAFLPLAWLLKKYPEQNIVRITETVMGKYLGVFFNIIYFLYFIIVFAVGVREFSEIIKTAVLPLTPISVLIGLIISASVFGAYQGIESISRGNWLFTPFIILALLIILLGILPFSQPTYIFPLLGTGALPVLKAGIFRTLLFSDIIFLGILASFIRSNQEIKKIGMLSLIISGITMIAVVVVFYIVFLEQSTKMTFPLYQMARLIFFGRFVTRIEVIFVFIWVFIGLIRFSANLFAAAVVLAETLKLSNYKPLLFPITIIVYAISLIPLSFPAVLELDVPRYIISAVAGVILPFIVFLVALVRNKRQA